MPYIGIASLYLAGGLTIFSIVTGFLALRDKKKSLERFARGASAFSAATIALATFSLLTSFLRNEFRIAYVARNSARSLPVIYKISALWAGQSGSLLLWLFIISLLVFAIHQMSKYRRGNLDIQLSLVINPVRLLFLVLLLFVSSPFELLADPPYNGSGLNPMLQSLGMVFHPPLLFVGFSGFLIPFAFGVVGLWTKDEEGTWLARIRPWVLFSWAFLTAGIVTGGRWAYTELGWGGYWAWDPVENASLFPWLTGTALLHMAFLSKQHRSKKLWTFVLVMVTYILTIFGTFLTRSGVLDSVHAFSGGVLGRIFLVVLGAILLFSLGLAWSRRHLLCPAATATPDQGLLATEINILLGALLMLLLCAGVFFGTMFPVISRLLGGREVVLDASFFNQMSVPFFLGITFLMGLSPVLWGNPLGVQGLLRRLWLPTTLAVGMGAYTWALVGGGFAASLSFALVVFGLATHFPTLIFPRSKERWGAALVHVGFLVLLMGVTGSSVYVDDVFVSGQPGQEIVLGDYVLEYSGLKTHYSSEFYTVGTTLAITKDGQGRGEITSEKTFWQDRSQPSTGVGIFSTYKEDLYLNLAGWENPAAQLHLQRFALVRWIWVGSWVIYFGAFVILLGKGRLAVKGRQVKQCSTKMS